MDLRAWLYLGRVQGVGPRIFLRLLDRFEHPENALGAHSSGLTECGIRSDATIRELRNPDWGLVDEDLAWLSRPGHHLVTCRDSLYPRLLGEIHDFPPMLFVVGDPEVLAMPQIAIVGSRNPTPGGRNTASSFAAHLARCGLFVTSGLAEGIDGAAHLGALAGGGPGGTVAVLGTGPDRVYPSRHRELAQRIAEKGALVSEFPPGTRAKRDHFPRRNRIISGLAVGTLVVEAARQSGSLITARHAMEQGREVFAVPGSIHNPLARGCHALIRQGAKLIETADDILEEIGPLVGATSQTVTTGERSPQNLASGLDDDYLRLLSVIGYDPIAVDQLIAETGLTANEVSSMLLLLELEGHVSSLPGGRYCRAGQGECEMRDDTEGRHCEGRT